jgi:outer membrane protein
MKHKTLLFVLSAFPGLLFAQNTPLRLTIREAEDYALQHNKTYQNAQEDVAMSAAKVKEARSSGLPQVKGSMDYMTYFNYEFQFNLGSGGEPPQINYSLLDAGDMEVLKILNSFSTPSASSIVMSDQASANVQVSQLIFNGQYWVGLELARLGQEISRKSLSLSALDIKQQVVNTCHLILITQRLLDVIKENEADLQDIAKHTQNLYEAGMAQSTDVDQIKVNLSQLSNSKKAMERNLELNFNMLRLVLGLDSNAPVEINENLDTILASMGPAALDMEPFNPKNNLNYQLVMTQEKIGERNVDLQKWSYAPNLVGFYNYKKKILTTAFDLSPNHSAGFTLSIPIFAGGQKSAQLAQAKIALDKTNRSRELMEQQLMLQKNQLTFALKNAYDNFQTQKENVLVARRLLASIENKFKQGMISSLDLTQGNSNYLQAENNYVSSALELLKAKLELDKLYNKL